LPPVKFDAENWKEPNTTSLHKSKIPSCTETAYFHGFVFCACVNTWGFFSFSFSLNYQERYDFSFPYCTSKNLVLGISDFHPDMQSNIYFVVPDSSLSVAAPQCSPTTPKFLSDCKCVVLDQFVQVHFNQLYVFIHICVYIYI
jgi:hypothetical protein